jgi:hypothetical protein
LELPPLGLSYLFYQTLANLVLTVTPSRGIKRLLNQSTHLTQIGGEMDQNKTYYEHCRAIEEALGITIGDSELLNQLVGQARELRHAQPGIIYQTVAKTIIEVLAKPVITPANMADYLSSFLQNSTKR